VHEGTTGLQMVKIIISVLSGETGVKTLESLMAG
jgi:hypothetical protein